MRTDDGAVTEGGRFEHRGGAPAAAPRLSVVVVPFAGAHYLERCLDALARQADAPPFEIVVPVAGRATPLRSAAGAAHVREIRVAGDAGPAALRAAGLRASRGDLVAFTEDHCIPAGDWCAAIVRAQEAPHAAIGGAVEKEGRDGALAWALYLCDYGRYMRPLAAGPAHYLTDVNVSYKREALRGLPEAEAPEFHETAVNWALARRGDTLWLDPAIVVRQQRGARWLSALRDRFVHGWIFAGTRVPGMSAPARAVRAGLTASLPGVLVARAAGQALRRRRHLGALVRATPAMIAMTTAWSLGELAGYLLGRGPRSGSAP